MLSLLDKIGVPGLPDVEIFRDHKKDNIFYALRSTPVVARDQDGKPALSYNFFSRNADIAYASSSNKELVETQLGQLLVTVDLSLSKEEHKIATTYLKKILNQKSHAFVRRYHKRYKRAVPTRKIEPILTYPGTWKDGTVRLEILEGLGDTFKKSSSSEVKPSLTASNSAAVYATFGVEGAQLMFDALSKGFKTKKGTDEKTPIQAIVRYDLKGYAHIPNLEVKVRAKGTQIYEFLQTQKETYKKHIQQGKRTKTKKFLGVTYSKKTTTYDHKVDVDKEDINSLVEQMIDRKVVRIEITDYGDMASNSAEKKEVEDNLRKSLMELIFGTIIKSFFETAFIGDSKDEDEGEEGASTGTSIQPDSDLKLTHRDKRVKNQDHYYYFRNDIKKTSVSDINFHFKKNGVVEFLRYPNGTLSVQLTESERKAAVRYIDVSSPEVQMLEVQVKVNADFVLDNIDSVIVNVNYKQKDHKSGIVRQNAKSFLFETGEEVFTFRVSMARNAKGELVDFYNAEAKISYKGTADAPPPIQLNNISDRVLNVSYDKLGFITTQVTAGDIDWTMVKEVVVDMEYKAEPNKPDSKKQIRLNQESLSDTWKCFMYGHEDKSYRYKKKWIYLDGTQSESDYIEDTREVLSIDDDLVGRAKASFDVLMDTNSVTTAKVEIIYEDKANVITEEFSKWFTGSETWDWSMRLREGATNSFKYRHFVQYVDGLVVTSDWEVAKSDEDIPPIDLKRHRQALTIDGGLLDWTKWKMVYATVSYKDTNNNYEKQDTIRLDQSDFLKTFEILSFHPGGNEFECTLKYAGDGKVVDIPMEKTKGGILILEDPEGSDEPIEDPLPPVEPGTEDPIVTPQ
ncbi:hypothetical protein [uncultured Psychroserpens sp.]|uniref:hypothetical protein n=1 Tax=uncultured Psychroserpens sp. TaxID=255436 RepID=UPI002611751E|nr:hypothetical protein [uncultured Psychroserpens sp.]